MDVVQKYQDSGRARGDPCLAQAGSWTSAFREKYFPLTSAEEWNDWRWQTRNRIRTLEGLEQFFDLTADEREAIARHQGALPAAVTPYYASLFALAGPDHPLRKTKIPRLAEYELHPGEVPDPLGEDAHSPVPGIVHTYPDKVLFLVTDFCATYCRYCTRARLVGGGEFGPRQDRWETGLAYIATHPEVRDVLVSGGDPLILSDDRLEWLVSRIRAIPHVELIRLGTKVPAVLPQRITPELAALLGRFHPLFMSLHFVHPEELTPESIAACERLADAGIPLGGQSVLLKGVNDNPLVLKELMHRMLKARVRPYYLHQCDAIRGSTHFKTTVSSGLELMRSLHGFTSGYAIPQYMVDAPGGGGKVPLVPDYVQGREGDWLVLQNYAGGLYRYFDPVS